jgi:hypothetical protein
LEIRMTIATTANFSQTVLEVEFTPLSGVYTRVCGLTSRDITHTSTMATSEVPDCNNEDSPAVLQRQVQSQEVTVSAAGVWSAESHQKLLTWWASGATLNIRIHHVKANSGDTEYETGPAFLSVIANKAARGTKTTGDLTIEFDGLPANTLKP